MTQVKWKDGKRYTGRKLIENGISDKVDFREVIRDKEVPLCPYNAHKDRRHPTLKCA